MAVCGMRTFLNKLTMIGFVYTEKTGSRTRYFSRIR